MGLRPPSQAVGMAGAPQGPPQPGLTPAFLCPQVHAASQELWPDRLVPREEGESPSLLLAWQPPAPRPLAVHRQGPAPRLGRRSLPSCLARPLLAWPGPLEAWSRSGSPHPLPPSPGKSCTAPPRAGRSLRLLEPWKLRGAHVLCFLPAPHKWLRAFLQTGDQI